MVPYFFLGFRKTCSRHLAVFPVLLCVIGGKAVGTGAQPIQRAATWSQKEFITTFWCPPPQTDEALTRVAAEGFNLPWVPPEALDAAHRHKLRAMLTSDLRTPAVLEQPAM